MNVNLQEFWTVQQASGLEPEIFTSYDAALRQLNSWDAKLDADFERWKNGDRSISILIESQLESDLEGGCFQSYCVHPEARPSGIYHHEAYTKISELWKESKGYNKIRWGNKATARPTRELIR